MDELGDCTVSWRWILAEPSNHFLLLLLLLCYMFSSLLQFTCWCVVSRVIYYVISQSWSGLEGRMTLKKGRLENASGLDVVWLHMPMTRLGHSVT